MAGAAGRQVGRHYLSISGTADELDEGILSVLMIEDAQIVTVPLKLSGEPVTR